MSNEHESQCEALMGLMLRTQVPAATKSRQDCPHGDFAAAVAVARLEDSGTYHAEIRIVCVHCHEPMRFRGVTAGFSPDHPTVSIDGLELNAPIEPEIEKQLQARASYTMPRIPTKH